ncbi:MAG: hypothetical protein MJ080_05270 [Clostridia bacterium]|nr:hypothetical protein [Clostridia bacterium]
MSERLSRIKELYENGEFKKVVESASLIMPLSYENEGPEILMYSSLSIAYHNFYLMHTDTFDTSLAGYKTACEMFPNINELKKFMITYREELGKIRVKAVIARINDEMVWTSLEVNNIPSVKLLNSENLLVKYNVIALTSECNLEQIAAEKGFDIKKDEIETFESELKKIDSIYRKKLSDQIFSLTQEKWVSLVADFNNCSRGSNFDALKKVAMETHNAVGMCIITFKSLIALNKEKNDIDYEKSDIETERKKIATLLNAISGLLSMYISYNGNKGVLVPSGDSRRDHINDFDKYANILKKIDPDCVLPERPLEIFENEINNSGGCYVATCVYGSYDCPQVWILRRFRDDTLASTWYGRAFIHTYYAISPTLVKWFGNTNWFKNMWKPMLDRMVENLRAEGVEDTPYKDSDWK